MRLLHTSDWHVGKTLRGRPRGAEHEAVLGEIASVAAAEDVDLVLVAGDLFDTAAPAPEAERIVYQALLDLASSGAIVVAIAGNHDNARRLQAIAPLLALAQVQVQPGCVRADRGGLLQIDTARGERARIALVPFLSQRYVVRAAELMGLDADQHAGRYAERVRRIIAALTASFGADEGVVNLVAAHLMVTGGALGGGERSAHIFDYEVPASVFPPGAQYIALGHLHRPQQLAGACPIWFSGSPLQLDFGEADDRKCVVVVDVEAGKPAEVREVPLSSGRTLRTVRGSLAGLAELGATDDLLRVIVDEPQRAGLADEVRDLLPNAIDVVVADARGSVSERRYRERLGRSPRDLFHEYLTDHASGDDRLEALFAELLEEAHAPDPA